MPTVAGSCRTCGREVCSSFGKPEMRIGGCTDWLPDYRLWGWDEVEVTDELGRHRKACDGRLSGRRALDIR